MPNNKKSSSAKKKEKSNIQRNLNKDNLAALERLSSALSSLGTEQPKNSKGSCNGEDESMVGIYLSHWRELNDEVNSAYKMLFDGAELIHATSTKYTLVGKIDINDGSRFSVS